MNQSWSHAGVFLSAKTRQTNLSPWCARWWDEFFQHVLFSSSTVAVHRCLGNFCSLLCLCDRFRAENKLSVPTDFSGRVCAREIGNESTFGFWQESRYRSNSHKCSKTYKVFWSLAKLNLLRVRFLFDSFLGDITGKLRRLYHYFGTSPLMLSAE